MVKLRVVVRLGIVWCLVGCGGRDVPDEQEGTAARSALQVALENDAALYKPAEMKLFSAHGNNLTVSRYRSFSLSLTSSNEAVQFKLHNCTAGADTGLLVSVSSPLGAHLGSYFNDDGQASSGNCTSGGLKSSCVHAGTRTGVFLYTIRAFSRTRATAVCDVLYRVGSGAWTNQALGAQALGQQLGGLAIDVGPVRGNEAFQVFTRSNGAGDDDTRMVLFTAGAAGTTCVAGSTCATTVAPLEATNNGSDRDPYLPMGGSAAYDAPTLNILLVGKETMGSSSAKAVETHVSLLRTPPNADIASHGGASDWTTLANGATVSNTFSVGSGRWYAAFTLKTDFPLGRHAGFSTAQSSPTLVNSGAHIWGRTTCPGASQGNLTWYRGHLNEDTVELQVLQGGSVIASRRVPRGAFGSWSTDHSFYLEFARQLAGSVTLRVVGRDATTPNVRVNHRMRVIRNPDATELTVAVLNMFYHDYNGYFPGDCLSTPAVTSAEYRNASNLLATRGEIEPAKVATPKVKEPADRAPFQWGADIVHLTEVTDLVADLASVFRDEAQGIGARSWSYAYGADEFAWFLGYRVHTGYAINLVAENAWPTADSTSILWDDLPEDEAGVEDLECERSADDAYQCRIRDEHGGHIFCGPADNCQEGEAQGTTPVRAMAYGPGNRENIPVAVFNLHPEHEDRTWRYGDFRDLLNLMHRLLETQPSYFNTASDPSTFADNRIILLGDLNLESHRCGEHYWILELLRSHFGYAVDLASALPDSNTNSFGMHNYDAEVTLDNVPTLYQPRVDGIENWTDFDDSDPDKWRVPGSLTLYSNFPWWAKTFRGNQSSPGYGGDRHDAIILVGRGWENDDPVRAYEVMQDSIHDGPFTRHDAAGNPVGVEMFYDGGAGAVPNSGLNYNPRHDINTTCVMGTGTGTGPGRPALMTDHRPIAGRIRIYRP
jgi:hypothetical protein